MLLLLLLHHHEGLLPVIGSFAVMPVNDDVRTSSWFSPTLISFAAGVLSSSAVWYYANAQRRRRELAQAGEQQPLGDNKEAPFLSWAVSMDDIKSRIGELPSLRRRQRWPWDRRRTRISEDSDTLVKPDDATEPSSPVDEKSGFCIGSIFGLDVGGTLAKLVYFEERPEYCDTENVGHRERSYQHSASAQAVLMARRGLVEDKNNGIKPYRKRAQSQNTPYSPRRIRKIITPKVKRTRSGKGLESHSMASEKDLESLYKLRQESVPDDLHAYADTVKVPETPLRSPESMENLLKAGYQGRHRRTSSADLHSGLGSNKDSSGVRKSRSMFDLTKSQDQAEALDRFYTFARRLDSYREGVKDHKLSFYSRRLGGEFHFIRFETRRMKNAMDLIRAHNLHLNIHEMGATGGGAHKYAALWEKELGIAMKKQEELDSLVAGMQFVLSTVVGECYTFRPRDGSSSKFSSRASTFSSSSSLNGDDSGNSTPSTLNEDDIGAPLVDTSDEEDVFDEPKKRRLSRDRGKGDEWWWSRKVQRDAVSYSSTYPYILVTIGTGVSILRVDGPRKHERISGSTIGGGTYLGLIRLLTDFEDFDDIMKLAERGDPTKVDMMVGDIYGDNIDALEKLGLPADLVASSFAKLAAKEDPAAGLKEEDLARAVLLMITINIGQVAYLNAQLHKTSRIYFVGNFLRENKLSQRRLAFAIDYWSKGEMEALFLEHEGYFGALGAFLLSQGISHDDNGSNRRDWKSQHSMPSEPREKPLPLHKRSHTMASIEV